jgi:carbonic anhydrase
MSSQLSRRNFVGIAGATSLGLYGLSNLLGANPTGLRTSLSPDEILQDLLEGNARFASGKPQSPRRTPQDFALLSEVQLPEAVIIACADSRVPPELLFDQGVGDLFVVRVAGNIVSGAGAVVKGSIEYAVAELGVKLIMVLGHSNCGAVKAAVKHINDQDPLPGAIDEMVKLIQPAVERAKQQQGNVVENSIRENVLLGVERLKGLEPIIKEPVSAGHLKVVGATYDLATGRVHLTD